MLGWKAEGPHSSEMHPVFAFAHRPREDEDLGFLTCRSSSQDIVIKGLCIYYYLGGPRANVAL